MYLQGFPSSSSTRTLPRGELGDCQYVNTRMLNHTEVATSPEGKEGQRRIWGAESGQVGVAELQF